MTDTPESSGFKDGLEGGAYEIIRHRLLSSGKELRSRLNKLNQARKEIFGSIDTELVATERISTSNNCTPRDMIPLNHDTFLFGYNVHMGLKTQINLSDVLAVYEYREHGFTERSLDILRSGRFEEDFQDLYRYYKKTRFAKFSIIGPHLYLVFRTGQSITDIKVFKFRLEDGDLTYVDNRSEHEFKYPTQHEFDWQRTSRDAHKGGRHPHISLDDRLFVEAVGGDITFKVEDNTDSGQGIYAEPVEHQDQTLDDADIHYALVDHLIIVKIKPYQEEHFRYYIFNEKLQEVLRVDAIGHSCVQLPENHGLIFSNGYYLQSGVLKVFDNRLANMLFERRLSSANGEDYLYIFYNRRSGDYALLAYNVITQQVEIPILCNGFSIFASGEMLFFRREPDPVKHHVIQCWKTPYINGTFALSTQNDSFLYKIGNPNIVRGMAESHELLNLIHREPIYSELYYDLVQKATTLSDTYFWLDKPEAFSLNEVISQIKEAAAQAIDEFEKVVLLQKNSDQTVSEVTTQVQDILKRLGKERVESIDHFVHFIAELRELRGSIISLRDLRYVNLDIIETLDQQVVQATASLSNRCVEFLIKPTALVPYEKKVTAIGSQIEGLLKVSHGKTLQKETTTSSNELEMLIEVVSNLKIDDATQTTRIIDAISTIYTSLNQVKAALKNKIKSLQSSEGVAEFNAQIKLLSHSVINFLDLCDSPEKCEEYLTKVMIQIEELEGRFSDFDEFIMTLAEKRDEIYGGFEARKQYLMESRNRRADTLLRSAERILKGIASRVSAMDSINGINGYFASDLMIEKIRNIVEQLITLGDTVKADDIQARLKTVKEDTVRQLKDRSELYADGDTVILFGKHRFSVNRQPLDLTILRRKDKQLFHLTGTNFYETIDDEGFNQTLPVWDMSLPSEDPKVYRSEFLAYLLLTDYEASDEMRREIIFKKTDEQLLTHIREFMAPRYAEGYSKGIHDVDACNILRELITIHDTVGLLRFPPKVRALAHLFWLFYADQENRTLLRSKLLSFGQLRQVFANQQQQESYLAELVELIRTFNISTNLFSGVDEHSAGLYLFHELVNGNHFVVSFEANVLVEGFGKALRSQNAQDQFKQVRTEVNKQPLAEYEICRDWLRGFGDSLDTTDQQSYLDEAAVLLYLRGQSGHEIQDIIDMGVSIDIQGMLGDHPTIENGIYHLNYHGFDTRLTTFTRDTLPLYERFQNLKKQLITEMRHGLRLEEFKPRILTSFVRNKLINNVYLPLIGDNLAKQIGVAGEDKRTDLMGLLLLISPPGYGKTTLMEYLANRLGIIFMKINGPAIGNRVTSLDPAEAPFASAREELHKLNLALEMGDNVMLYLDDIQHCNPEFLQKFISLCDGQRKIEGIYKGRSRTYDLRGKKVVVVMAGNPFTESGEKFKIPDMLANRADTYNLGDIIGDTGEDFKLSYLENCLTSNSVLNQLASKSQKDVYAIIRIAETDDREGIEFEGNFSNTAIDEMTAVMKKLLKVRDIILAVNTAYIYSAGQADAYRTEPPFQLQGSYRNMNRLAEKIVAIMNDEELDTLLLSHYENESQTLTTGAEANLLKFKELVGWLSEKEEKRWLEIKKTFMKQQTFFGADGRDPVSQVVAQLSTFQDGLNDIRDAINKVIDKPGEQVNNELVLTEQSLKLLTGLLKKTTRNNASRPTPPTTKNSSDVLPRKTVAKIPRWYLQILNKQFDLMNSWMAPTLKELNKRSSEHQRLAKDIKSLQSALETVIKKKGNFDKL